MRGTAVLAATTILATSALAVPPPPPVIVSTAPPQEQQVFLVQFTPGAVTCDGSAVTPLALETPQPAVSRRWVSANAAPLTVSDRSYRFAIDARGRAHAITAVPVPGENFAVDVSDVAPSLAGSRFAPAERSDCTIRYAATFERAESASPALRMAVLATPSAATLPPALRRPAGLEGSTCLTGSRPAPVVLHYVDRAKVTVPEGSRAWTVVTYDLDASGRPVRIRTAGSSGNASLDRATAAALGASRYEAGARTGCFAVYSQASRNPLPAPPMPERSPADNAACPADLSSKLMAGREMFFPHTFRRRMIEGWAIIRFDVASWGQVGNAKLVAAEPAAVIGDVALAATRGARLPETGQAYTGCIARVRYAIANSDSPAETQ